MSVNKKKILIIDDEDEILELLYEALSEDFEVHVFNQSLAALEVLKKTRNFDAILCDISMPNMDGIDFYRVLKSEMPGVENRILFITGGTCTERTTKFMESTANPFIEKPFTLDNIKSNLLHLIGNN